MPFDIYETNDAEQQRKVLATATTKREQAASKAVTKAIRYLAANSRHPSLGTHEFTSKKGPHGQKVWEAYAENDTPSAYRIFFYYGPGKGDITIMAITPHP